MEEIKVRREFKVSPIPKKILHDKVLIKRILITLGIVIVYKLIGYIPIPGINIASLQDFFNSITRSQGGGLFGIVNMFSGGAMRRITILGLGLMPYFSSCVLIMLLGAVIPLFRKYYAMEGQKGREKIVKSTYYLTVTLSLIQACFISLWLENPAHFQGLDIVTYPGWGFRITAVVTLTAGVLFLLWLAKLINDYGIGNGVAILALSGIIYRFIPAICQLRFWHARGILEGGQLFFLLIIFIASIVVVWLISKSTQKVPITYKDSNIKDSITLRFSWAGQVPLNFAQSILLFPATLAALFSSPLLNKLAALFQSGWLYAIIYSVLIFFFTYFFTAIVFKPQRIEERMKKFGCQIENVELNGKTAEYLDAKMTKNTIITALFLIAVAILPTIYNKVFNRIPYLTRSLIGGSLLIIMVGVFYDLKCQIESYFKMKEDPNVEKWQIAYIAFDEIEAEIKKGFLVTKAIPCVIEPLRFTWGMPIKTAVDQYRLYVPEEKIDESRGLL